MLKNAYFDAKIGVDPSDNESGQIIVPKVRSASCEVADPEERLGGPEHLCLVFRGLIAELLKCCRIFINF